jgi:hypothetical protein
MPPYPISQFPKNFAVDLGREIVYILASRGKNARLEGIGKKFLPD